jgi:hypothetical protein
MRECDCAHGCTTSQPFDFDCEALDAGQDVSDAAVLQLSLQL